MNAQINTGTIQETASKMQLILQFWEQLIFTTGRALALEKYFYVAMDWDNTNDEYSLKSNKHSP
jgi:hypothetical protein